MESVDPMTPAPNRRWFAYSLRTLFVVVTLAAVPISLLSLERSRVLARRAIASEMRVQGCTVGGAFSGEPIPGRGDFLNWLSEALGDEGLIPYVIHPQDASEEEIQRVRRAFPEAPMWIERGDGRQKITHRPLDGSWDHISIADD
jgi:hypothetical protein